MSPYWICQLIGWSLFGLLAAAIPTLYGGLRPAVIGRAVVGAILGLLLTNALRRHMLRHGWLGLPAGRLFVRLTAAGLAIAALMVLGVLPFLLAILPERRAGPFAAIFAGHASTILVWCGIY